MSSNEILICPKCKAKYKDKIYKLSCMHSFCEECLLSITGETETRCQLCGTLTLNKDVIRNIFLEKIISIEILTGNNETKRCEICDPELETRFAEKYCIECFTYMCEKCLGMHDRIKPNTSHRIVNKDKIGTQKYRSDDLKCLKHNKKMKLYCAECEELICSVCCAISHANHCKDDNILKIIESSKEALQQKIDEIDQIIKNIKSENHLVETQLLDSVEKIQDEINCQAEKLNNKINKISKELINSLDKIKQNFFKDVQNKSMEINNYILSLNNYKEYVNSIIEQGTTIDILALKKDLDKSIWIKLNLPRIVSNELFIFKPLIDIDSLHIKDSFCSILERDGCLNKNNNETLSNIQSVCVIAQNLYVLNDKIVHIYDMELCKFKFSIDLKIYIQEGFKYFQIIGIRNHILIFHATNTNYAAFYCYNETIHKLDIKTNICSTWNVIRKLKPISFISSAKDDLILVAVHTSEIYECSFEEILRCIRLDHFKIEIIQHFKFNYIYKLNNGNYVTKDIFENGSITLNLYNSSGTNLYNSSGTKIKSITMKTPTCVCRSNPNNHCTSICTDGDKYIFVNFSGTDCIFVLSNELEQIQEFQIPKVIDIYYDRENSRLIANTDEDILYFKYR